MLTFGKILVTSLGGNRTFSELPIQFVLFNSPGQHVRAYKRFQRIAVVILQSDSLVPKKHTVIANE